MGLLAHLQRWAARYLHQAGDDEETLALKVNLWMALFLGLFPVILTALLLWFLGFSLYATAMFIFAVCNWIILGIFTLIRRNAETIAFMIQLFFVFSSFGGVLFFGGILHSGGVVLVGLVGSLVGIAFPNIQHTRLVFGLYFLTIIAEVLLQPWLGPVPESTPTINLILFAGHIIVVAIVVFSLIHQHIKQNNQIKQAETDRLKQLDAAKTQLYNNITHEFRTPLTAILGMVSLIRDQPRQRRAENLTIIERNANYLLRLVTQMLDLSKVESGAMPIQYERADIIPYLCYLMESFHSLAEAKKLKLSFATPLSDLEMDFDPRQIEVIVANLLSNAIKFTPPGGKVILSVDREEGSPSHLILKVIDNGIGIPKDQLSLVFDRFQQVERADGNRFQGTGIGLALVKEVVKLVKGEVAVRSREGEGTEFIVRLPIIRHAVRSETDIRKPPLIRKKRADEPDAPGLEKPAPLPTPTGEKKPLLLIVEDSPDVVVYLRALLKQEYRLLISPDGRHGLSTAVEHIPDIILSDVMMPQMDGFEMCDRLKKDTRTSHIPIVLLTARADHASRIEGLDQGADAYLTKPFNREELATQLRKLIELRRRLQQHYMNQLEESLIPGGTPEMRYPKEDAFLRKVYLVISGHLGDCGFGVPELSKAMGLSRSQLYRKFSAVTGQSVGQYLRSLRLQKARELLRSTDLSVTEIAFEVGYNHPSHFSRAFLQAFGIPPSQERKRSQ